MTFIVAPTVASLDNLLLNEFLDNPNIQNEENVFLLGDFLSSSESTSTSFEFVWKSFPIFKSSAFRTDDRGSKFIFCFAEYDKRDHSLKQLARFAVWIDSPSTITQQSSNSKQQQQQPFSFLPKINSNSLEPLQEDVEQESPTSPVKRDILVSPEPIIPYPSRLGSVSPGIKYGSASIPNYPPSSPESVDQYTSTANNDHSRSSRRSSEIMPESSNHFISETPLLENDQDPLAQALGISKTNNSTIIPYSSNGQGQGNVVPARASGSSNGAGNNTINTNSIIPTGPPNQQQSPPTSVSNSASADKPLHTHVVSSLILPDTAPLPSHQQQIHQVPQDLSTLSNSQPSDSSKENKLTLPRPSGDSVQQSEDGPVFRAQIADFEKRTSLLKTKFKKFLKRAITVHERQTALLEAHISFLQSIQETADTNISSFNSLTRSYFNNKSNSAYFSLNLLRKANADIHEHVIEPAKKLYEQEIKSFDIRKREFDDESREYYAWLSRYLSVKQEAKGKKKSDSDSKYIDKKRAFELCRFDYYTYLQDLNGGRKQQLVTYHLALFAESEISNLFSVADRIRNNNKQAIDMITNEAKEANKEWSRHRAEREVHRRAIERLTKDTPAPCVNSPKQTHQSMTNHALLPSSQSENSSPVVDTSAHFSRSNAISATPASSTAAAAAASTATAVERTMSPNLPMSPDPSATSSAPLASSVLSPDGTSAIRSSAQDANFSSNGALHSSDTSSAAPFTGNSKSNQMSPPPSVPLNSSHASPMLISSAERGVLSPTGGVITTGLFENDTLSARNNNKQGLLWAMSRPGGINEQINLNKPGWHKFWVVLGAGKLCEYTNWKQSLDLHNEPINLKMALVREARNAERRFCFEVVTPNYKRVYQATSEEDMHSWIQAINNGISSSLEESSVKDMRVGSETNSVASSVSNERGKTQNSHFDNSPSSNTGNHQSSSSSGGTKTGTEDALSPPKKGMDDIRGELAKLNVRKVSLHRRVSNAKGVSSSNSISNTSSDNSHHFRSTGAGSNSTSNVQSPSSRSAPSNQKQAYSGPSGSRISATVRGIDTSNNYCADCGSTSKVEWISINLLVVLCIDCSGVHRSLGSHISKVRSLTLDTASFTTNFLDTIKSVNNSIVNSIWEAKLPKPKASLKVSENRQVFITEKYVDKKYLEPVTKPNALLRLSVKTGDIGGILAALASGADSNTYMIDATTNTSDHEPLVMYALKAAPANQTTFPVAEILILNSADTSSITSNPEMVSKLSSNAIQYLMKRSAKGAPNPVLVNAAAASQNANNSTSANTSSTPNAQSNNGSAASPENSALPAINDSTSSANHSSISTHGSQQHNNTTNDIQAIGRGMRAHSNSLSEPYKTIKPTRSSHAAMTGATADNSGSHGALAGDLGSLGIYRSHSVSGPPSHSTTATSVTSSSEKPLSTGKVAAEHASAANNLSSNTNNASTSNATKNVDANGNTHRHISTINENGVNISKA